MPISASARRSFASSSRSLSEIGPRRSSVSSADLYADALM
jgi:hypothetical protein